MDEPKPIVKKEQPPIEVSDPCPEEKVSEPKPASKPVAKPASKPFEYSSKDDFESKVKKESKPRFLEDKPRHKISSSVDKGKAEYEQKTLNFKTKKSSENSAKTTGNSSISNNLKETSNRLRQSIKKDSIKLKSKIQKTGGSKKPKPKDAKKRRRPRSNDDRKKDKTGYYFDNSLAGKRTASRGASEKNTKVVDPDQFQRRTVVNKFLNNSHMLVDPAAKIDSRNIFTHAQKQKKNWNSASVNLKKFIKKKDLKMVYPMKKDIRKKKSQETKLATFQASGLGLSADQHFANFIKGDKQYLMNPYFPGGPEFSKSFGSSTYMPMSSSTNTGGKKLAALKNCLILNTYSNKNAKTKPGAYVTTKAKNKANLSFNEKTSMLNRSYNEHEFGTKKKRSVSPMTKNGYKSYTGEDKSNSRSGSRKNNMRSPNAMKIY